MKQSKIKITIITVSYNSVQTIGCAIESVLRQDYPFIEYIVVDGGSTDGTPALIATFQPRFGDRMKWVSEPDKGIYDAMNKGIRMATGDVVGILNSDDLFTKDDIISQVADAMADQSVEMVYGDVHFVDPSDLTKCVRYYSSAIFHPSLFRFGFMPAHPSCYIRKHCYDRFGLYALNYTIAADYDLLIRMLYREKIASRYLPLDMVTMRTGGVSTMTWHSRLLLNREIVKACSLYGIKTSLPLLLFKYIYKVKELFARPRQQASYQ